MTNSSFAKAIRAVVRSIPPGEVLSYGEVAHRAGCPGAARAVGTVMRYNSDPTVPCHRVVHTDGRVGGYNRGVENKITLLRAEGVSIRNGKIRR